MSIKQKGLSLSIRLQKEPRLDHPQMRLIKNNRPSSTINSPRFRPNFTSTEGKIHSQNKSFPYSGLSIGLIRLQKRESTCKPLSNQPVNYTHYFADVYMNSETISFPKVEKVKAFEDFNDKARFFIPNKVDFRRLRRKSWNEQKCKEEVKEMVALGSRSAGKNYENNHKKKKELIPVTKHTSRMVYSGNMGLKIKGILRAFK